MFLTFNTLFKSNIYLNSISNSININNYKFIYKIHKITNICILNFTLIALYLYKLYVYIYNLSLFNYKILFINDKNIYKLNYLICKICNLINYPYILKWIPGLLTNWNLFKKKVILFIWLKKILYFNNLRLILSKTCINNLQILYKKLYIYFNGLYTHNIYNMPKYICLINSNLKLIVNEILKLKLILISFINLSIDSSYINIKILGNYYDYKSLQLIFKIIYTAIIHSKIKNN